jgi:RND family efflux transporter MFP subunit
MMPRDATTLGSAALFLAAIAFAPACRPTSDVADPGPMPVAIHCESPRMQAVDETVDLRGRVQPPPGGDLPVASQIPGRLAQVLVREGESVKPGDVVATVDDASTRDVSRQADAALDQARATEANARATLDRTQALVARGIAARQELDDALGKAAESRASVAAAVASADLARRTLGRVVIRSSFGGIVTRVWRGPGALVDGTAATPIVQLASTSAAEFVADATGGELAQVKEGDRAQGSLLEGRTFEGAVVARGRALDPATGLGSVRVAIVALDDAVPLGSYGRASVTVAHREGVHTLPATALRGSVADGAEVAVCEGSAVAIRKIGVGWRDDARFEVTGGLKEDDRVAVDHVLGLDEGTTIEQLR